MAPQNRHGKATKLNSWKPDRSPILLLVPSLYFFATRMNRVLDIIYLVATSYVPAYWILARLSDLTPPEAGISFLLGYLCFISFYEIGYFFNDTWDSLRQQGGRRRIAFSPGAAYSALFVVVRLATWGGVAYLLGWFANLVWLACYLALAVAMLQHNLILSSAYRAASFYQLAVLRFVCPIAAALPREHFISAVLPALLLYAYPRFMSYLDSKELLTMPERRQPTFGIVQITMLAPFVALLAYIFESSVLLEILAYFMVVFGAFSVIGRSRRAI